NILLGAGLVTVAVGLIVGAAGAARRKGVMALCFLALLARTGPALAADDDEPMGNGTVVFQRDTNYHRIVVTDDGPWRVLKFNRHPQSAMLRRDPYSSPYRY